jgi:ABC-type transporter Mla maintaining outer membrane lipid asymmetry ATPase subunit MlaF
MIEFQDVQLAYGKNTVFNGLNFAAQFHEKIAILGGSGQGKTTILRLMLGLTFPDSGKVLI